MAGFHVAGVVERVEDADDIDAVADRALDELFHHVVRIVLVAQDVLAAQQHLQLGVGQGLAQLAQALPRILVQEAQAGVKRGAAPALQRRSSRSYPGFRTRAAYRPGACAWRPGTDARRAGWYPVIRTFAIFSTSIDYTVLRTAPANTPAATARADHARDVGAHGVHQQEVAGIFLLRHLLGNARRHRARPRRPPSRSAG